MSKIPVTVLTGFLGSGKTTLLNRILTEQHGQRIAVIENEFGEIGIDQALVINADEEVFEMNNGCICCTVRGDLIRILGNLMKRRDKFDRILVETTGMADPGPVAQTFFVDDDMGEKFSLDGIVTLVDAKHVHLHLEDSQECHEQIAFADVIVLNKIDLVTPAELDALEQRIARINGMAKVLRAHNADVPLNDVLNVGGFDLDRALDLKPTFLAPEYPFEWAGTFALTEGAYDLRLDQGPDPSMNVMWMALGPDEVAHARDVTERVLRAWTARPALSVGPGEALLAPSDRVTTLSLVDAGSKQFGVRVTRDGRYGLYTEHLPSEHGLRVEQSGQLVATLAAEAIGAAHAHDSTVTSVGVHLDGAIDAERFQRWVGVLLRDHGKDIFRMKGIVNLHDSDRRYVFQGVHMLWDGRDDRPWGNAKRSSDMVFIGRNLDREQLTLGFTQCLR